MACYRIVSFILVCWCYCSGYSQDAEFLVLPKNASIRDVCWRDSIYRFPSFQPGRITFAVGYTPEQDIMLNLNFYFSRIELINDKNDTVEVVPTSEIKYITLGGHHFYVAPEIRFRRKSGFAQGYIEVIVQSPIGLGVDTYIRDEKRETWPYNRVADVRGQPTPLDRYYKKVSDYYFLDNKMRAHPASKITITNLFRAHKKEIVSYIDKNHIDFEEEVDLIRLVNFCSQLQQDR